MNRDLIIEDKSFELFLSEEQIRERIHMLALEMTEKLEGKTPIFIIILNGAFFFAADLLKMLNFEWEVSFVKVASYKGISSSGSINTLMELSHNVKGRNVVIIEDIVDTGLTVLKLREEILDKGAANIQIASLLVKPETLRHPVQVDYSGFTIPGKFVVGYGMDYNERGRNLRNIFKLKD